MNYLLPSQSSHILTSLTLTHPTTIFITTFIFTFLHQQMFVEQLLQHQKMFVELIDLQRLSQHPQQVVTSDKFIIHSNYIILNTVAARSKF